MTTKYALVLSVIGIVTVTSAHFSISNSHAEDSASSSVEVNYYDGLGTKMRHEKIYQMRNGEKVLVQDRIYTDSTNQLQEEWILGKNGKKIYIRPDDGSVSIDGQEYPSGSLQAEEAKQSAAKRYSFAKAGSRTPPQSTITGAATTVAKGDSGPSSMETAYYDGIGTKMRHEKIFQMQNGTRVLVQDRIYTDSTNQLQEEWILGKNGKKIYIRPDDGSVSIDGQEYPSGSPQAEEAKQSAAKRYSFAKAGSSLPPQPASAIAAGTVGKPTSDVAPSDLGWDPMEDSKRQLVQDADCYYREDKNTEGTTSAMRLIDVDARVCGSTKVTLCVGKVYCFRKGTDIPFSLTVACPAVGPESCPEPKTCALSKSTKVSPGYGHYPSTGRSQTGLGGAGRAN